MCVVLFVLHESMSLSYLFSGHALISVLYSGLNGSWSTLSLSVFLCGLFVSVGEERGLGSLWVAADADSLY